MTTNLTVRPATNPVAPADLSSLKSCEALALQALETRPAEIPEAYAKLVPTAQRAIKALLRPAPVEQLAIEIKNLAEWAEAFNIPSKRLEKAAEAYHDALKHLPSDLLSEAFKTAKSTHRMGMRLPLPSEIAATVKDEWTRRTRLKTGLWFLSLAQVMTPPEERATPAQWAELRKHLVNLPEPTTETPSSARPSTA